jgi:altronate dehydratase
MSAQRSAGDGQPSGRPQPPLAIVMHEGDTVAVLAQDVARGDQVTASGDIIAAADSIPRGHKIARRRIATGEPVIKYGEIIGLATREISRGSHVHVHNVASARLPAPTERSR